MMKKFTLMAAFAAMTLGAAAQNVAVTSSVTEGDIENGATVIVPWEIGFEMEGMTMFEWNPHFTVRSLSGMNEEITVYATSSITAQLCWPSNCQAIMGGNEVNATGTVNGTGSDLQFDRSDWDYEGGSTPSEANSGTGCLRIVDSDNNEIVINVEWSLEKEGSGVENIATDINAPVEYYSLTGVRVNNPGKGIYIVKRGNKVTREIMR
ncbi:MAG: hypothetical protein K2K26_01915 [Muribaculaceae bacterium]|nr:hypothetical protein [Muribaculaceae bacterium]